MHSAITGETGTGKSMIIKALEYCSGKKKSIALYSFKDSKAADDIRIDISLKPSNIGTASNDDLLDVKASRIYTKTVSLNAKKSMVTIDGKRTTAKHMQQVLV